MERLPCAERTENGLKETQGEAHSPRASLSGALVISRIPATIQQLQTAASEWQRAVILHLIKS